MRVASIIPSLSWKNCGIRDYAVGLSEALSDLGVDMQIIDGGDPMDWLHDVKDANPDIVHLQYEYQFALPERIRIFKSQCDVPFGVTMHTVAPHLSSDNEAIRDSVDFVIVASPNASNHINLSNYISLYLPDIDIDLSKDTREERRKQLGLCDYTNIIATFGMFYPHKGMLDLVNAMPSILNDFKAQLLLFSSIPPNSRRVNYMRQCLHVAEHISCDDDIRFYPEYTSLENIIKCLTVADLIVLPYRSYGSIASSAALRTCLCAYSPILLRKDCDLFADVPDGAVYWWDEPSGVSLADCIKSLLLEDFLPLAPDLDALDKFKLDGISSKIAQDHIDLYSKLLR